MRNGETPKMKTVEAPRGYRAKRERVQESLARELERAERFSAKLSLSRFEIARLRELLATESES